MLSRKYPSKIYSNFITSITWILHSIRIKLVYDKSILTRNNTYKTTDEDNNKPPVYIETSSNPCIIAHSNLSVCHEHDHGATWKFLLYTVSVFKLTHLLFKCDYWYFSLHEIAFFVLFLHSSSTEKAWVQRHVARDVTRWPTLFCKRAIGVRLTQRWSKSSHNVTKHELNNINLC